MFGNKVITKEKVKDILYAVRNEFENEIDDIDNVMETEISNRELDLMIKFLDRFIDKTEMVIDDEIVNLFDEYRLVALRDSCDCDNVLGAVYLHNKHSLQDFQNAIYKAKEKRADEIYEFGEDWTIISEELGDFDYIETYTNLDEDSIVY